MSLPPPGGYLQSPPRHRKSASTGSPGSLASHHSRHGAGSYGGQTIRRLSDDDVRAIFECLHHQVPLPTRLSFLIVPVGSNGLKLSPPSYEFQDGLYVLLRPPKKQKSGQAPVPLPQAPEHLQHLVVRDAWSESCPWSLSGPQFPQPTAIQQRYCYPKGAPAYSSRVGGALWTMYTADNKEDLEFRLLHVYFSAKRAVNKGVLRSTSDAPPTPSPMRSSRWETPGTICHSPLSFDWSPSSSAATPRGAYPTQPWTPVGDSFRRKLAGTGPRVHRPSPATTASTMTATTAFSTPNPVMRKRSRSSYDESDTTIASAKSLDALDMESSLQEIDAYWNDPLMTILMQPSHEAPPPSVGGPTPPLTPSHRVVMPPPLSPKVVSPRLQSLATKLRDWVDTNPELATVVRDWAEGLATEFKDQRTAQL